jgi:Fur family ferric uptake transcriptional regulator
MIAIYEKLEKARLRATSTRVAVLSLFHAFPREHFTVEQVYRALCDQAEPCSLASVYRALALLSDARLIVSAALGDTRVVYELNRGERHYHVVCDRCARVAEVYDPEFEAQQAKVAEEHGFSFSSCNLVIFGVCAKCAGLAGN